MAAPYVGLAGTFYNNRGTSTLQSGIAMTRVGTTLQYYATNRLFAWWDPAHVPVILDGVTPIVGCKIDYAGGYIILPAAPVGTVTANVYTTPMEMLGGGFGFSWSKKGSAIDTTIFPDIAGTLRDKSYIGSGICEFTASLKRHFFYAMASVTTAIATAQSNLTWTWKGAGSFGNDEAIRYVAGTPLSVVRAANETLVTYVTNSSLASQVKAMVEADASLSQLWDITYPVGNDGSGKVGDVAHTHASGGRDSMEQVSQVANKVLAVFYLDNATVVSPRLEGVAVITGLNMDDPLEGLVESNLDFQGTGELAYHAN